MLFNLLICLDAAPPVHSSLGGERSGFSTNLMIPDSIKKKKKKYFAAVFEPVSPDLQIAKCYFFHRFGLVSENDHIYSRR